MSIFLPPPRPTSTFFVIALDELRHGQREARARQLILDLRLERAHEHLLPRESVEIRVGVPVADVVERLVAGELLVARLEVDRRVAEGAAAVVEVAPVDVEPDAADAVDDAAGSRGS